MRAEGASWAATAAALAVGPAMAIERGRRIGAHNPSVVVRPMPEDPARSLPGWPSAGLDGADRRDMAGWHALSAAVARWGGGVRAAVAAPSAGAGLGGLPDSGLRWDPKLVVARLEEAGRTVACPIPDTGHV